MEQIEHAPYRTTEVEVRFQTLAPNVLRRRFMNETEWTALTTCVGCGAQVSPDVDRGFACSPDTYLCFDCAEARGGVYDANEDRWTVAPDTSGLQDERRPHA